MARLHTSPYNFKRTIAGFSLAAMEEEQTELRRLEAAAQAIKDGSLAGNIIDFPVADGKALYLVKSESPSLVLQHIPFFDGYAVAAAHIRGLRVEDVRQMVERKAKWKALSEKQMAPAAAG